MAWQLSDPVLVAALGELGERARGRYVLAGTVAAQAHLARALGPDKQGPPARAIDVIRLATGELPDRVGPVPIRLVDARGFEASITDRAEVIQIGGTEHAVAAPEHVLGTTLAGEALTIEGRWACFALMRALEARGLDLEEVRGILKRADAPDREVLLHELAYLAA